METENHNEIHGSEPIRQWDQWGLKNTLDHLEIEQKMLSYPRLPCLRRGLQNKRAAQVLLCGQMKIRDYRNILQNRPLNIKVKQFLNFL